MKIAKSNIYYSKLNTEIIICKTSPQYARCDNMQDAPKCKMHTNSAQ